MRVLVTHECSGIVREAFAARGHDAWSCDLKDTETPGQHIQGDALEVIRVGGWDLLIMHPECTYLAVSGLHWNGRVDGRKAKTDAAIRHVEALLEEGERVGRYALENPVGCISSRIREPDQIIQPWQFGDDASKATCLWLGGLPRLAYDAPLFRPVKIAAPRVVNGRPRWSNQTDSGQNKLAPSPTRQADRSRTYAGIAAAMAEQWG